ncbi:MAG: tetratricopeptide repeat protein [Acidobacteriota bacterium]
MTRRVAAVLLSAGVAACGGGTKSAKTTPSPASGSGSNTQSMQDTGMPDASGAAQTNPGAPAAGGPGAPAGGSNAGAPGAPPEPAVVFPNQDPDPAQAKAQVDQHLSVAKRALALPAPDGDTALREAREALKIDAANVDAAAYVAYAYYAKKQLDTSELVLDELFKRPTAKSNANVYYVYGLVYDHTNRPEQAVLAFKKATELDPSFASAWVDLGVHQLENKQYQDAIQTFEKATKQLGRNDAATLDDLGSAYRGAAGDLPPGSGDRTRLIQAAEAAYKRSLQADPGYGLAYYNLALLYLDFDPFPSGGGSLDPLQRIDAAKAFLSQYKNAKGVDMKLFDERMKDVAKAEKRAKKAAKSAKKGGK